MHYASFKKALGLVFTQRPDPLAQSPLIVDLGCGPATTSMALFDWLSEKREGHPNMAYIGIDSSEILRRIALEMVADEVMQARCTADDKIGPLPGWAQDIGHRLVGCGYFESLPDQMIVNEYEPGQGISPHIDREACFGPSVASLSLASDIIMDFQSPDGRRGAVLLPARSMVILTGDARYTWQHGIAARKSDSMAFRSFERRRRVSMTFRTVLLPSPPN